MKLPSQNRRRSFAILATLLAAGAVLFCLFLHQVQKRKTFVSDVDPTSGYRCRFTLSTAWNIDMPVVWDSSGVDMGANSFTAPPPHPIRRWLESRLLHRAMPAPARIYLASSRLQNFPLGLKEGYPRFGTSLHARILLSKHLRIDGCPATLCRWEGPWRGKPIRATMLYIYAPASATIYILYGLPEFTNADQVYREIQEMGESFHVEKVAVRTQK